MIRRVLMAVTLMMMCSMAAPISAHAFDPFNQNVNCGGDRNNSAVCSDNTGQNNDPIGGTAGVLIKLTHIVALIGGAVAVIMIIVGSIRFITSGTDLSTSSRTDTDVEEAKATIAGALIGLFIIAIAQYLIVFVIKKFIGS